MSDKEKVPSSRRKFIGAASAAGAFGLGIGFLSGTLRNRKVISSLQKQEQEQVRNYWDKIYKVEPSTTDRSFADKPNATLMNFRVAPIEKVKIGIIGLGNRGASLTSLIMDLSQNSHWDLDCEIVALCDIQPQKIASVKHHWSKKAKKMPQLFDKHESSWKELCALKEVDIVIIATPWQLHAPMGVYAMQQGKHVAIEVPIATNLEEHWQLLNTAEKHRKHCCMLENCCYNDTELSIHNMVKQKVFGEVLHGECAYIHDLRDYLRRQNYYKNWRFEFLKHVNGNLYPTHGLGPMAQYMDIGRGDNFASIVSMSSPFSLGDMKLPPEHPFAKTKFKCGNMNTSLMKTAQGKTIMIQHDIISPRPYSRLNSISGTKGFFQDYPAGVYIEGLTKKHTLQNFRRIVKKFNYEHPLWKSFGELSKKTGGHGGMDSLMLFRLLKALNKGKPLDMNVYDGLAWSVVMPLSAISVFNGNVPIRFPDFTRGAWKKKAVLNTFKWL